MREISFLPLGVVAMAWKIALLVAALANAQGEMLVLNCVPDYCTS